MGLDLPLLGEALLWTLGAYLLGLLIAWALWGRQSQHYD
ncbi:MAG: hypothetical protein AVDCRST_MAG39-5 [uncultured Sphingomonadaceae bacterium]|uniref:Uncharacterized protein n=1 Tax=uncultured Sphingomonadaceae bacterium TaxID=169976 RepID=A0A6J4RQC0_9SPHN|nr:MAG: hypothetical protein AVDCRST_MAG39-5 [uncultured Sphingomonadaceae bacterium]